MDLIYQDFWSFDPNTRQYTNLSRSDLLYRYGHTATALPNGQIVYIDGLSRTLDSNLAITNMNTVDIYDTITNTWTRKTTVGQRVVTRWGSSAVLGPDNKTIFVFGGNDMNNTFHNNIFLLDTTTWIWTTPYISGNYPTIRSYPSMGFIDTNILAILYGGGMNIGYNDINILRIDDQGNFSWLSGPDDYLNLDSSENTKSGMSGGEIAGIIVGVLIITAILGFCAWKTFNDANYIPNTMRNLAWDQRGGEPIWTEISRLILKFILTFLFLAYLVFSIRQALESPTTSITIRTKISSVRVPDVRFCVEGLDMPVYPTETTIAAFRNRISCTTDKGVGCSSFITWLDMSTHFPKFENSIGYSDCYLFSPPSWFRLGTSNDGYSNGTKLQFEFNGNIQTTVTTRITQYPPGMDPNVKVYKTNTSDVPSLMSDEAIKEWSMRDIQGINDPNTFTVYTNEALSIQYQIKDHQYLEETGWNRIGFLSRYNHTPELSYSSTKSNFSIMNERFMSSFYIFGTATIYPIDYFDIIEQDQKIYTIINSLGSVGGIISIVIGIQVLLFGFRPKSPWGIIQRWSHGPMRDSLVENLQKKFGRHNTPTPFISSVYGQSEDIGKKYDDQIDETKDLLLESSPEEELKYLRHRMSQMERRVQLTESLLEAYYVDVEIFRELDRAISNRNEDLSGTISEESDLSYNSTTQKRLR
ncbi:hypothetical protein CLU79DRAFT_824805 [Phycomyces nitens]|nr:hypothetical protein CLU79DRAFT_824805 [Phycomyces nitens]